MTSADVAVQIKLLILFTVGLLTVLGILAVAIFRSKRFTWRYDLPLVAVAAVMLFVLVSLATQ